MKNPFRYLWEWYAYLQAFLDDTILYIVKKLQKKAEKETDPKKKKKIHEKITHYIWIWLSKSLWERCTWFYEKYAELKKWDNLAEITFNEKLPKNILKARLLKTKMEVLWIKKWDIESLKKLKDKVPLSKKIVLNKKIKKLKIEFLKRKNETSKNKNK